MIAQSKLRDCVNKLRVLRKRRLIKCVFFHISACLAVKQQKQQRNTTHSSRSFQSSVLKTHEAITLVSAVTTKNDDAKRRTKKGDGIIVCRVAHKASLTAFSYFNFCYYYATFATAELSFLVPWDDKTTTLDNESQCHDAAAAATLHHSGTKMYQKVSSVLRI